MRLTSPARFEKGATEKGRESPRRCPTSFARCEVGKVPAMATRRPPILPGTSVQKKTVLVSVLATWHIRSRKRSLELSLPPSFLWSNGTQPPIEEGNRSRPPEKTRIFGQQITEEGIQRLQERSAKDLFRHDATSWMDQVHQLDACTYGPVSGCPVIVVVQPTHDRTSDHLLTCLMRGKS